jgi:hypothetical protein
MREKYSLEWGKIKADMNCGALAGFFSGIIVAPVELLKIDLQNNKFQQFQKGSKLLAMVKSQATHQNMKKVLKFFPFSFAAVCGLEFSVNRRISEYGRLSGIAASAVTGAIFLTAADHLMMRQVEGQSFREASTSLFKIRKTALWTGFSPMVVREAIFITSVMHLGPHVGEKLSQISGQVNSLLWTSIGRGITGVVTTLLSHPFDSLAREMQKGLFESNSTLSIYQCLERMHNEFKAQNYAMPHPLFRGAIPRMWLATVGGVLAGGFFEKFREYYY